MAEQRQPFRFRLPWLTTPAAPRPAAETQTPRPTVQTQSPAQPTTTIPIQRPPFRPPGIAPAQSPPPQAQAPPRTESQTSSPSRAGTESRVTSQPASPSRAGTESRAASLPPSPSRAATQSRAASLPPSPSRGAPQFRPASLPPSPSRTASQPQSPSRLASQPAGQTSSQPSSPSRTTSQVKQTSGVVAQPPSSVSQRKEQEPQSKTKITSEIVSNSQNQTPIGTTFQPYWVATQPSKPSGPVAAAAPTSKAASEAPAPPQTSDSSTIRTGPKPLPESGEKSEETKEGKVIVQEHRNEYKINDPANEEQKQMTVTKLLTAATGSKTQAKEQPSVGFQEEQKRVEKQEVLERKETLTPSGSHQKQFKTVNSTRRMDRNTVDESRQNPGIFSGERAPLHKEIREDISKFVNKLGVGHHPKQALNEKPATVVTLAGENRGASMHLGSGSAKKEGSVHIHRGYKINPDESAETNTDGEGSSKGRSSKYPMTKEDPATKAYINSNIQSINNSILSKSSITEGNPGVQLDLSRNPTEPIKSDIETESLETRKAEFNITPAEKLTYEPTVRRRCLRGLLMESSDSDPDNPAKPRRHGCRYGCGEKSKDEETSVL